MFTPGSRAAFRDAALVSPGARWSAIATALSHSLLVGENSLLGPKKFPVLIAREIWLQPIDYGCLFGNEF
jgi:hypothetical protein